MCSCFIYIFTIIPMRVMHVEQHASSWLNLLLQNGVTITLYWEHWETWEPQVHWGPHIKLYFVFFWIVYLLFTFSCEEKLKNYLLVLMKNKNKFCCTDKNKLEKCKIVIINLKYHCNLNYFFNRKYNSLICLKR